MNLFIKLQELLLVCAIIRETIGFDYCTIESCQPGEHTMCKYPDDTIACAGDGVSAGLNDELRTAILDRHNVHRQTVALGKQSPQPHASNMMKLTWHKEAEKIAQRWANQCKSSHDTCRNIEHSHVGQNFASTTYSHPKTPHEFKEAVLELINLWYDEVKDFDKEQVQSFKFMSNTGHYTQMVWAETTGVGCGILQKSPDSGAQMINLFCNYVPGGNVIGMPIYKAGEACSECPEGTKCSKNYPGVCTSEQSDTAISLKASVLLLISLVTCVYAI